MKALLNLGSDYIEKCFNMKYSQIQKVKEKYEKKLKIIKNLMKDIYEEND
jgi:hypothetical protein